jgi:hypothetical protein
MAGQFVVTRGGRDSFCTEEELRLLAARGLLAVGDLVYHPVLGRWLYAREVEEVREQMTAAAQLGKPAPPTPAQVNGDAVAGFVLGLLGYVPLVGLICCLLGIYFSGRGLKQAAVLENSRGHGLALAGMVLSIVFLLPATACSAIFLTALQSR